MTATPAFGYANEAAMTTWVSTRRRRDAEVPMGTPRASEVPFGLLRLLSPVLRVSAVKAPVP